MWEISISHDHAGPRNNPLKVAEKVSIMSHPGRRKPRSWLNSYPSVEISLSCLNTHVGFLYSPKLSDTCHTQCEEKRLNCTCMQRWPRHASIFEYFDWGFQCPFTERIAFAPLYPFMHNGLFYASLWTHSFPVEGMSGFFFRIIRRPMN